MKDVLAIAGLSALIGLLVGGAIAINVMGSRVDAADKRAEAARMTANVATAANAEWEAALVGVQTSLARCQAQWTAAQQDMEAAVDLAAAYRQEGVRQAEAFRKRWASLTGDCTASLASMQTACEHEIGEY